jgi:hypothetical protein
MAIDKRKHSANSDGTTKRHSRKSMILEMKTKIIYLNDNRMQNCNIYDNFNLSALAVVTLMLYQGFLG